jgi:hypothetical protein
MGSYDTYGKHMIQIKAGECLMKEYNIGNKTDLPDGIYVGYEGVVAINKGKMVAESECLIDKWGGVIHCSDVISIKNPLRPILEQASPPASLLLHRGQKHKPSTKK